MSKPIKKKTKVVCGDIKLPKTKRSGKPKLPKMKGCAHYNHKDVGVAYMADSVAGYCSICHAMGPAALSERTAIVLWNKRK